MMKKNEDSQNRIQMPIVCSGYMPGYANAHAAGLDLRVKTETPVEFSSGSHATIHTGVCVEIPEGYFGLIAIRSGLGMKGLVLSNGIGVIDSDYRGEIRIPLFYHGKDTLRLEDGERVAQMIIIPCVQAELIVTDALNSTERGESGFGSSGRF
ncbi:MAG: dUTP diphosphatase [Peptoniphilaceae bacterium]|nr:dUTP diphosphatase [Peptoniphilaceae bacterium]